MDGDRKGVNVVQEELPWISSWVETVVMFRKIILLTVIQEAGRALLTHAVMSVVLTLGSTLCHHHMTSK